MCKKLTTKEFIKRAKELHGDKYDYSNTEYKHSAENVEIKCNDCQEVFKIIASNHINIKSSRGKASGCYNCFKMTHSVFQKLTTEQFKKRSVDIHNNKFDYSLTIYVGAHEKVEIICPNHGKFYQRPSDHLDGAGCMKCRLDNHGEKKRKTSEEFIREAKEIHGEKFVYTNTHYKGAHKEVEIICPKHGTFYQIAHHHLDCKWGCPGCSHAGISKISLEWLEIMKIVYNCNIINGLNSKEFKIDNVGKVDGFCSEKNFVFEFHGDFWHGNPKIFKKNDINSVIKKEFGELYNKTIIRDLKIIEKGFNFIFIWEYDWNLKKKLNKEIIKLNISQHFKCENV